MSSSRYQPAGAIGRFVHNFEEIAIAALLGLMTLVTFVNVVLRYGFDTGLIWGLELVTFMFAWLVLLGISYAVKMTAHLGVDALINALRPTRRKFLGLLSALLCIVYAFLLLKGAWDYWANFANLPQTTGRWFPTGLEEMKRTSYRAWYTVIDIPLPEWLRWLEPLMNEGEAYEKLPRFIPYAMLPIGMALLLFRFVQAGILIMQDKTDRLIVSHEAEDAVADIKHMNSEA